LHGERRYGRWRAYGQSKLANLLFTLELDRRLRSAGSPLRSIAAHPGYAATNLQSAGPPAPDRWLMWFSNRVLAQSAAMGALPTLYAATHPDVESGTYVGPDGMFEGRGYPKVVDTAPQARDESVARRLWALSEELTGVRYELASRASA
jgi:NAD(P)-dependent dehydrogenase (short-subunit alcohol dehydrogenase family)